MLMPLPHTARWTPWPAWSCHLLAAALILGAAGLHLAYLALDCPLDLAPDEAHYWDWSRHLDWSYYSKGPLVAYLIRGGCELLGPWSLAHTGNLAFAVRFPAVICGSLLLASLYLLTWQVFGRLSLALAVVAAGLTLPLVAVGSALMTIDAPYTCCWGWALVFGYQAVFRKSWWAWPLAGLAVGLGILAKYTMVLWIPSLGLFLLATPEYRHLLLRRGFWVLTLLAGLCCLPILVWNWQHDFVTFRHVSGLSGATGSHLTWTGPFVLLGGQCALLLIFWFVAWLVAMIQHNPLRERDAGRLYLWWLSAPMFLVFLAFSFKTGGGELNWPVTTYISGLVLAAHGIAETLSAEGAFRRWFARLSLGLACVAGLVLTVFMHRSDWLYPVLEVVTGASSAQDPYPLRRVDPTCRLRGWRALAVRVDELRARLRATGGEPVVAATGWSLPGELGVYCSGNPQAYSLGLPLGDRHSQYDLWYNPINHGEDFRGKSFVVVGGVPKELASAFAEVEPTQLFQYEERGRPIGVWAVTVCHGFRGLDGKGPWRNKNY